jgi:para-aminobenzoate synthetase component 1
VPRGADWESSCREIAAAFAGIRAVLADLACITVPGLPPFQGGVAGLVAYECGLARLGLEPPPAAGPDPLLSLHAYDVVFAYNHDLDRGWFLAQGVPARGPVERARRGRERLMAFLAEPPAAARDAAPATAPSAASHPLPDRPHVCSTHSRNRYLEMVQAGIELVHAGDIFQANLAQRFETPMDLDPVAVYLRAREVNPAPFAGYLDAGSVQVASMSPERFLQVCRGVVRTHPIKGTRRVTASPEADLYASADLEASEKDRAENVMIVDLLRNDLARVCTAESVRVEALCRLERYRYVQHLVSVVSGRLRPGLNAIDALEAAIPGGSISGAPKHRACEIISAVEQVSRGCYCGSLGYVGFDGTADFNTLGFGADTRIAVYTECPSAADAAIACNDNIDDTTLESQLIFSVTANTTYYLRVGNWGELASASLAFTLSYTEAPNCNPVACDDIDFNNNDVFPEDQDVIDFFNVLAGAECPECNDIDFNNNDVFPEDQDVIDFFNVLAGGTCP